VADTSGAERTDYTKKDEGKELKSEKLGGVEFSNSGSGTGPTGSAREYPKGKGVKHNTDWNPQKMPASTYAINGVKCD
jgi:hypothetical protein